MSIDAAVSAVPELPATTLISTVPTGNCEGKLASLDGDRFTRLVDFELTGRNIPKLPESLEEVIELTESQLQIFAGMIGASVVPHQFGIIPVHEVDQDPRDLGITSYITEDYARIVPSGYLLGCEVAVVDPVATCVNYWEEEDRLRILHRDYRRQQIGEGNLYLTDVDRPDQYVFGFLRESGQAGPLTNYLVDIEPRLAFKNGNF